MVTVDMGSLDSFPSEDTIPAKYRTFDSVFGATTSPTEDIVEAITDLLAPLTPAEQAKLCDHA